MNSLGDHGREADQLVALVDTENPFDYDVAELLPRQLAAVNERFQDRVHKIKLLQNRAETGGISEVRSMAEIVPLLFSHTAYKSYPEAWLIEQKWDRLGRWLDTTSTNRVTPVDNAQVKGLDDWLLLLADQGHLIACSSGTTGKPAMMNSTMADMEFSGRAMLGGVVWAGLRPNKDRRLVALGQMTSTPRHKLMGRAFGEAQSLPDVAPFQSDEPPVTIGAITEMITLRKKIADGTAKPGELAHFEAEAAQREKTMKAALEQSVDALIESRHMKLHIGGMWKVLYDAAELVRARGYSGKDFQENTTFMAGGLKRAQVPPNYREFISETLNLAPERVAHGYGMQEINTMSMRCRAGRYHLQAWLMLLLLDDTGERLVELPDTGEAEGRAGFFDISLDGRWGGVISGDKIRASREPCACGTRGVHLADDIQRYADMADGDKIACAGTIDAYVRGVV